MTDLNVLLDMLGEINLPQLITGEVLGGLLASLLIQVGEQARGSACDCRLRVAIDTVDEGLHGFRVMAQVLVFELVLALVSGVEHQLVQKGSEGILGVVGIAIFCAVFNQFANDMVLDDVVPLLRSGMAASGAAFTLQVVDETTGQLAQCGDGRDAGRAQLGGRGGNHRATDDAGERGGAAELHGWRYGKRSRL